MLLYDPKMIHGSKLTGVGSGQRAKHVERRQLVQAILSGVSRHCVATFLVVAAPAVVVAVDRRTSALNPQPLLLRNPLHPSSCLCLLFVNKLHP